MAPQNSEGVNAIPAWNVKSYIAITVIMGVQ